MGGYGGRFSIVAEGLRKGMLEKYWDSHLPLARDVNLTPRIGREGKESTYHVNNSFLRKL